MAMRTGWHLVQNPMDRDACIVGYMGLWGTALLDSDTKVRYRRARAREIVESAMAGDTGHIEVADRLVYADLDGQACKDLLARIADEEGQYACYAIEASPTADAATVGDCYTSTDGAWRSVGDTCWIWVTCKGGDFAPLEARMKADENVAKFRRIDA